jgi:hypothetical protein
MMRKPVLYILLLLVGTAPVLQSQDIKVTAAFDSTHIYIGDQIKFTVTVDQPSGLKLTLPIFKDSLCKNIDIISGPLTDSSIISTGRIKIIEKYLITSFDSGLYQVPPVYAELKNEEGLKRFYSDYTRLRVMRVNTAPADTSLKIYDIIQPYRAPVTFGEIIPWILIAAVMAALIWVAIRFVRNMRKKNVGIEKVINPDPAHVIAFRELEKLKGETLWQKGEVKAYYTRLTEILRQYLENRFGVFSLELTTAETLDALVKTGFRKDGTYNQLKAVLTGADLVKFAKYKPEPAENESHFDNSWEFVQVTKEADVIHNEVPDKKVEGSL